MGKEEYEILPHQELEYLRKEVDRLKKNPFGGSAENDSLLESMNKLTTSINRLLGVLQSASDELVQDYHETKLSDRLEAMQEQNEKIARGIVAVGQLSKQILKESRLSGTGQLSKFTKDVKKETRDRSAVSAQQRAQQTAAFGVGSPEEAQFMPPGYQAHSSPPPFQPQTPQRPISDDEVPPPPPR